MVRKIKRRRFQGYRTVRPDHWTRSRITFPESSGVLHSRRNQTKVLSCASTTLQLSQKFPGSRSFSLKFNRKIRSNCSNISNLYQYRSFSSRPRPLLRPSRHSSMDLIQRGRYVASNIRRTPATLPLSRA